MLCAPSDSGAVVTATVVSCPVCEGVGAVRSYDVDASDVVVWTAVICPACEGKGAHLATEAAP